MPKKNPIYFEGREWSSITECARALGVSRGTIYNWMDYGYKTAEEAKQKVSSGPPTSIPVYFEGREWASAMQCAKVFGVHTQTILRWVDRGYKTVKEAERHTQHAPAKGRMVTYKGVTRSSVRQLAAHFGISHSAMSKRLKRARGEPDKKPGPDVYASEIIGRHIANELDASRRKGIVGKRAIACAIDRVRVRFNLSYSDADMRYHLLAYRQAQRDEEAAGGYC